MSHYNQALNTLFIHVPKTAGTSMEQLPFLRGTGGHRDVMHYRRELWFRNAYKWGFVRNPYDRFVSAWLHMYPVRSFRQVIGSTDIHFIPMYQFLCDGEDNILVDFVGRYENLEQDWSIVSEYLGVQPHLPHMRDHKLTAALTPEQSTVVGKRYEKDFEIFTYERTP